MERTGGRMDGRDIEIKREVEKKRNGEGMGEVEWLKWRGEAV